MRKAKTIRLMRDSFEKTYCREVSEGQMSSSGTHMVIDPILESDDLDVGDQIEVTDTIRVYNNHFETITKVLMTYRVYPYDDLYLQIRKFSGELIGKKEDYTSEIRI